MRATATVLSYSQLQRVGSSAVIVPPKTIVLLREEDDGASFAAPLEGEVDGLEIGEVVELREQAWPLADGSRFVGVVARRRVSGVRSGSERK